MYNDNIAIENFITYCDDMMIAEEGLFSKIKNKINQRKEDKRVKQEKELKTRSLILKYGKKYIYPESIKMLDTISKFIEDKCKKKGIKARIETDYCIYDDRFAGIECVFTFKEGYKVDLKDRNNDTSEICDEIVDDSFYYIMDKYPEFYAMMDFNSDYGDPGNYGFGISLDSSAEKYLERYNDFKKEKEALDKK